MPNPSIDDLLAAIEAVDNLKRIITEQGEAITSILERLDRIELKTSDPSLNR